MRVETETVKISKVYLSSSEQEKIKNVAQMFDDIYQQAETDELIDLSSEIIEKINDFLDNYMS